MAEKNDDMELEIENVTFEENPLRFCKQIYKESSDRVDQLKSINVENHEFYEGIDKALVERKNDPLVQRSSIFVHQLTPAIDTRVGDVISKLEERECPITGQPIDDKSDDATYQAVANVTYRLNQQMRDSGYLTEVLTEHVMGAEIYRTPSVVKVGWRRENELVPESYAPTGEEMQTAVLMGRPMPEPGVRWKSRDVGEPYAEWLRPDEFLYQPNISLFAKDSDYCGHRMWLDKWEVISRAKMLGWNIEEAQTFFENIEVGSDNDQDTTVVSDEVQADKNTPNKKDFKEGKFVLVEWYVVTYDDSGKQFVNQVIVLENKVILYNKKSPFKGFKFPFVLVTANQSLGSVENISSVDKGKFMQRLYNETINSFLDGLSYRIFPPFKKSKGNKFHGEPVYGLARVWELDDIDDLKPVIENPGQMPDLPALMEAVASKIRDLLNAPDFNQGFNSQQYEKATASKLRASGSARRSTPTTKRYGMAILEVAYKFLALNQQFADDGPSWVVPVVLDVPSLTNVSDPDEEKQEALLLYQSMAQDPMFQTPNGQRKVRNAWERIVRLFVKTDVDRYSLTEPEFAQDMQIKKEMQKAAIEKQSIREQLSMEAADPPQQPQGATNNAVSV